MMALNFAAISAGATGVRSAASEAKAKAIPIACGALNCEERLQFRVSD